jgi:sulfoxide reductase heme-binding subunit YedZ
LIPLALTSTAASIRYLGGRRWQALHRLIYFSAIAGVIHYIWLVKADLTKPLRFAVIVAILLGFRVVSSAMAKRRVGSSRQPEASRPEGKPSNAGVDRWGRES